jgi:prepilin peptidase CpaA
VKTDHGKHIQSNETEIVHVNTGFIILISALVAASLTDIAHRRIPNAITYPLAAFGLLYHLHAAGMDGLIFSISGILVGAGLLLLFHLLGGMGAGDVKLMAAVGAILGPADVFTAFLYSALIGGLYALVVLWRHGALQDTYYRIASVAGSLILMRAMQSSAVAPRANLPRLCYGMAISLGTVLSILGPLPLL